MDRRVNYIVARHIVFKFKLLLAATVIFFIRNGTGIWMLIYYYFYNKLKRQLLTYPVFLII